MMDVQSFISGLAGGVQKPIPTQEMRLFMHQQRAAGPPAAVPVLQEPRLWAQQHHTQAQNSLPFHGCTNGAGSFQPFYPQHSGLSGDHASFHLNHQPATAVGAPWMPPCGVPNGQQANSYCLPNHYDNPIDNSKPAVSNEGRPPPHPAPATTASPCVQARSVVGEGGSQTFEGRKSTYLENPWQYAPRTTSQIQREASPSFRHFDLKDPRTMMAANQPCQVYASPNSTPASVTHLRHGTIPGATPEYQDRAKQYRVQPHQQFQYPHPYQAQPQTGQEYQYLPSYHIQNQQLQYLPSYEMRPAIRHHNQLPHQKIQYFPAYRMQHQAEQFRHQNQTQQQTGQPQQFQYQHLEERHQKAQNLHQTVNHQTTQNKPMNQTRYQAAQHQNQKQAAMQEQSQLQRQYQMQRGQTAAPQSYHGVIRGVVPIELSQLRCPAGVQGQHTQDTRKPRETDPANMPSVLICKPTLAAGRTLPRAQRIPGVLNQTECGRPQAPDTTPHRRLRSSSALPLQSSGSPDTPPPVLGSNRRSLSSTGARSRMNQNDGSYWTAAEGDDSVKTDEQAPSGHGRLPESAVETLPSVNPARPNLSSSTRLQSSDNCVSEDSAGALVADTAGVTAGSRKPTMNAQRIAGSRRPAPRTCASVGTINPRNVSNIGEKYKDRLLTSSADRKCSRPEMRKSLWEANTKTRACPTTSALPRSDIATPVTANPTHKSKASPNSTVRGSALSGGRSRGNRGLNVRSSSKESEASDTKMLGEDKPSTAGAMNADQSRLTALSQAAIAPGKALPRGVQKNPSSPLLASDSGRETAPTEKIPPSRRGIPTLTRPEIGKHSRSTDRRHSELSASHGRLPLSGKADGEECDIGESYARRRRYSMLRRGTVSSPVSRLVSAEGNSRTAARSGTGTRPRPETVTERAPRRPGLNSILRNSNGTDSLKTRTFGARSGVLRAAASRKQSAGVPSGNAEGNRSRDISSTVGGRRLESGDRKSTGGTSRSTSSLESSVLPEVSLPQDDDTHSDLCGKVRDALLEGSGIEESRLGNSVRFSRFESGLDEEPNIDEDEVVLSGQSDVTTGSFLGIEVVQEDRRHSKPASDSQTMCPHPDYRKTRSLPGEEEMDGRAALNATRMRQACGTVMPPNRKIQDSTVSAVMKGETTVQSTTPSDSAAMSERSTSVSRGGCSTPPRSVSDVSGPQTWELSSAAATPVVEDVALDDGSVTVVPGRTGAAVGVSITKQGLLREAPLISDHEAISQPMRDSATMSLDREAAEFTTGERRRETVSAVIEAAHLLTSNPCHVPGRETREKINQVAGNPCRPGAVTHQQPGVEESAYYNQAQSDVLNASGAHHLSAPREQISLPVEQNIAELTEQACAKRSKTPNEKGEVQPSTLSLEPSAECTKDQQNAGIFPQAASKAPTAACASPLEASASIPDSVSAAAQHAHAEEQLRQQVRAQIEHKFRQLQDEQLRQHCLAQQQQQLLQQVNLRKKEAFQQAEQRAQMARQQIYTQKMGQGLVRVSQVQPGTSLTVPGPVNHQHPDLQRPAVHHPAGTAQPQGIAESAKSLTGHPSLRQLSGVHQEPQQRVVLRPAVSEQQLRRPTLSHSPARRAVPEQERRLGGETQQSNLSSQEAAAGQARAAELQRRLEIVRETNILRAFYSSADVQTPAFAVAAMEETHLDCHGDRDPHRPLRAPSAKGEPLSALGRRYLHSQSLPASACHPTGRQEHEAFVRELWSEKHRTQQDELRRNLALYQQGRPNGLAAAGIDPASAVNALRVSETAFQQPTAVSFVGPCPTAGATLPMTGAGSIEDPFPLVTPTNLGRAGPSPLSAGVCHLPMGDKGSAGVSPMANISRFVRERHVVAHPVVAVGNHVPM